MIKQINPIRESSALRPAARLPPLAVFVIYISAIPLTGVSRDPQIHKYNLLEILHNQDLSQGTRPILRTDFTKILYKIFK